MCWKNSGIGCFRLTIVMASVFFAMPSYTMTAYSLKQKEYVEEKGKRFWQIRVRCTDLNTKRYIVRDRNSGPWCAKKLPDLCGDNRVQAAVKVCSSDFKNEIETAQENGDAGVASVEDQLAEKAALKATLLEERVSLQGQRVELAQRKLDLRRREIDLQKRELEVLDRIANFP